VNRHPVRAGILVVAALALAGCGRAATPGTAPSSPPSVVGAQATSSTTPTAPVSVSGAPAAPATVAAGGSAIDSGTLTDISRDLNSVDSANGQTDADQQSADQSTATSDG
jgi:hypothetical protein